MCLLKFREGNIMLNDHITLPDSGVTTRGKRQPYSEYQYPAQHKESSHEKLFLVISIIIFALGFIAGIVCGNAYRSIISPSQTYTNITGNSYTSDAVTTFNTTIMLSIWIAAALFGLLFLVISFHFKNQKRIIERLDSIILHPQWLGQRD